VLDADSRMNALIFQSTCSDGAGEAPRICAAVHGAREGIQYAKRQTGQHHRMKEREALRGSLRRVSAELPENLRRRSDVQS